jgi:nitrite reductase (NADH) small subunit
MRREIVVGPVEEIQPGQRKVIDIGGRQIGVFNVAGEYFAIANRCFHQGGPLCRGLLSGTLAADAGSDWHPEWRLDGEVLICPWHSLEFNLRTGRCLAFPRRRVPTYPVHAVDGVLTVSV